MKLKDRRLAPAGGYFYVYDLTRDGMTIPITVKSNDGGFDSLVKRVENDMRAQGATVPGNLEELIENQICSRQPEGRCWKSKVNLGDKVASVTHSVAGAIDFVVKKTTGKDPGLKKKATGCRGCGKRRKKLNDAI